MIINSVIHATRKNMLPEHTDYFGSGSATAFPVLTDSLAASMISTTPDIDIKRREALHCLLV